MMAVVCLSLVVSKIVYFGFTPNYAADIFSRQAFKSRLDHDVYQYRILSKHLLFAVDDWLAKDMPEKGAEARLMVNMRGASERFYLALYDLNTLFLILTSIMVVLLVHLTGELQLSDAEKWLIIFLVPLVIGISEFTVACYDVSGYFFQLLILYIFLRWNRRHYWICLSSLALLTILSTINRESSALSVAMIAVLLFSNYGFKRTALLGTGLLAVCFLATYISLRYLIVDPTHLRIWNIQAGDLLLDTNIVGLLFWALFFMLPFAIARDTDNRWLIGAFFLCSLPYIVTCLKDGVLWEVRLHIPLFLAALFLSRIGPAGFAFRINATVEKWLKAIGSRVARV